MHPEDRSDTQSQKRFSKEIALWRRQLPLVTPSMSIDVQNLGPHEQELASTSWLDFRCSDGKMHL
eukprot:5962694-Alexandrium_andersonii.AAC.1